MLSDRHSEPQDDESADRFVLFSKHLFKAGGVKPNAFVPHPYNDLSVTRATETEDHEIWKIGGEIAGSLNRTLYGAARAVVKTYRTEGLEVVASPIPEGDAVHPNGNPNHADVKSWPTDKKDQKAIALKIAHAATLRTPPAT